jgi:membrane fusion protein (multidrug efflux system)
MTAIRAPAAALLFVSLVCGCDRAIEPAHGAPAEQGPASPPPLETVTVVERTLDTTSHLQGDLSAYESVALYARVGAFVSRVDVDRGSAVKKGALLAQLVAPELAAQRAEAEAKAKAQDSNYQRLKAAAATPGAVAGNELEAAAAAAAAGAAKAQALRAQEEYLRVTAPFDAVVTERNVHPGALVGPGSTAPMLRLEQQKRLRLTVAVPEPLVSSVVDGAKVTFAVRSWPGETFPASITRSSHSLDPRTRTMAVELDVDNAERRLAPGMFCEIAWPVRRSSSSRFVPASAIAQSAEHAFVVLTRDGLLHRVTVTRGASMGDLVEVVGELHAGDRVVLRATDEMREGTPAIVAPAH